MPVNCKSKKILSILGDKNFYTCIITTTQQKIYNRPKEVMTTLNILDIKKENIISLLDNSQWIEVCNPPLKEETASGIMVFGLICYNQEFANKHVEQSLGHELFFLGSNEGLNAAQCYKPDEKIFIHTPDEKKLKELCRI